MFSIRTPQIRRLLVPCLAASLLLTGCGGSSDDNGGTGPGGGPDQTFTATATPSSATVARGVKTATTLVFTVKGGLVLGGGMTINTPMEGFTVTEKSAETVGSTVTLVQEISADGSVPAGVYVIWFSKPLSGYTGSGTVYSAATTKFTVTVTQ